MTSRAQYFVNGWLDAAAAGGLSIAVFLALALTLRGAGSPAMDQLALWLLFLVNYPHFSATVYRLYQSPKNVRQFPVTSLVLPLLLSAAVAASLAAPRIVAPAIVTLYLIWSPYHYSGQTIGLTLLYAHRGGFAVSRAQRSTLALFTYSTFLAMFAYPRGAPPVFLGIPVPAMQLPAWFGLAMLAVLALSGGAFLYLTYVRGRGLPAIAILPALAQFAWFLPGHRSLAFFALVPFFHSLQYLYIAWAVQMGVRSGAGDARFLGFETVRWLSANIVGGAALFIALPWALYGLGVPMAAVVALVNIHHFFVDGVIWKLRHAGAASPLLHSIGEYAPAPEPAIMPVPG